MNHIPFVTRSLLSTFVASFLVSCAGVPEPEAPPASSSSSPPGSSESRPQAPSASPFAALPGWDEDRHAEAVAPLLRSCGVILRKNAKSEIGPGGIGGFPGEWREACAAAAHIPAGDDAAARDFFESHFRPVALSSQAGLFTGYYEAEFAAARRPTGPFRHPLYRAPKPPVSLTRAEIEAGALAGRGLELAYLADPVDRFFLHIQGSGRLKLADGARMRVGYAGNNGRPFVAIGKAMLEAGILAKGQATAQGVAAWLKAHPRQAPAWMNRNPRYVFFREVEGEGPVGALGVPLTPMRSLAVDPAFVPLGVPVWLDSRWPADGGGRRAGEPLRRLLLAQDTGAAIKGAQRGDVFWGTGPAALALAGPMKSPGRFALLLPKAVAERKRLLLVAQQP